MKNRRSRKKRKLARRINGAYYDETEEMAEFILSQWQKDVIPPVLDGLFGGKPCSRTWIDKSKGFFLMSISIQRGYIFMCIFKMVLHCTFTFLEQLTVRKNDDKKFNSKTMHNEEPIDECTKALCEIKVCRYEAKLNPRPAPAFVECKSFHWAAWGKWTQCDLK